MLPGMRNHANDPKHYGYYQYSVSICLSHFDSDLAGVAGPAVITSYQRSRLCGFPFGGGLVWAGRTRQNAAGYRE